MTKFTLQHYLSRSFAALPASIILSFAPASWAQGAATAAPPAASPPGSAAPGAAPTPAAPATAAPATAAPATAVPPAAPPPPPAAAPTPAAPPPPPPVSYAATNPLPPSAVAAVTFSQAGGHVILSADRLFGVSSWSSTGTSDVGNVHAEAEASGTMVNLLWANSSNGSNGGGSNLFAMPRLALDGFVGPNFTIGGSVGYLTAGGTTKVTATTKATSTESGATLTQSTDYPDQTAFIIQPRIGVALPVGERAAIWLRGGITYFHATSEGKMTQTSASGTVTTNGTETVTTSGTAVTLDPVLVILPAPHVGLTIGPAIDIGVDGSSEVSYSGLSGSTSTQPVGSTADVKLSSYGAAAGMLVFF